MSFMFYLCFISTYSFCGQSFSQEHYPQARKGLSLFIDRYIHWPAIFNESSSEVIFACLFVFLTSRNLKAGSTEKFLMPGFSNIGKLQKIQVRQTFNSWILKWKLNKVLVNPGWTGTQSDRSISQL